MWHNLENKLRFHIDHYTVAEGYYYSLINRCTVCYSALFEKYKDFKKSFASKVTNLKDDVLNKSEGLLNTVYQHVSIIFDIIKHIEP